MKPYLAAIAALGLLASTSSYAQQALPISDEQQAGQQDGQQQALSPRLVKQIQARLHQQGFYDGKVTGAWDEDTSDALQNFQEAYGLQPSGQLDGVTILALTLPSGQDGQQQQAGPLASQGQGRSMRQMGAATMGGGGPMTGSGSSTGPMGQGEQSQFIDAYQAGFQNGFQQGFRHGQAMAAATRQGQGTGQGSSQAPQQYRNGQQ